MTNTVRPQVARVVAAAPLPMEDDCTEDLIFEIEAAIADLPRPLTDDEATTLLGVLETPDESSYFGLLWSLVHAVETAPNWPPVDVWRRRGPWFELLRTRLQNAGFRPPA